MSKPMNCLNRFCNKHGGTIFFWVVVIMFFILVLSTRAKGQDVHVTNNERNESLRFGNNHSSTVQEGVLRGQGARAIGRGYLIESLGIYENLHEDARSKRIQNHVDRVHAYWQLKEEWRVRMREKYPPWTVREKKRLDLAEERHALRLRRRQLVTDGALPQPPEKGVTIRGKKYKTFHDWKKTYDYVLHTFEQDEKRLNREIDSLRQDRRHKQSVAFAAGYEKLSYAGKRRYHISRRSAVRFDEKYEPFAKKTTKLDREIAIKQQHVKWARLAQKEVKNRMKERGE